MRAVGSIATRTAIMERLDMMQRQGEVVLEAGVYRQT
jgi:hypothetical protein